MSEKTKRCKKGGAEGNQESGPVPIPYESTFPMNKKQG